MKPGKPPARKYDFICLAERVRSDGTTEVILAKNRNGPVGTIEMYFAGQFTLFYELTNQEEPEGM